MANLVDNANLTVSTSGNIQVMDSLGNYPVLYPGGAGAAPDNWWFLGGPDYGSFLSSGAVWDTRTPPAGGKSILLDIANPDVRFSGGVTQVVPLLQEVVKPICMAGYVAAEGCAGNPVLNTSIASWAPEYRNVGGGSIVFDTGTYDFVYRKKIFIPTEPAKYMYFHILHRGFSSGRAWYGGFLVEELNMRLATVPEGNVVINPALVNTGDDVTPVGWGLTGGHLLEELGPLGPVVVKLDPGGVLSQKDIVIDKGLHKQKITVHATSASGYTRLRIRIALLGRYRRPINEKIVEMVVDRSKWAARDFEILCTPHAEFMDVEIANIEGDPGYIGGVYVIKKDFEPYYLVKTVPVLTRVDVPVASCDTTQKIALPGPVSPKLVELHPESFGGDLYITDGVLGSFAAEKNITDPVLLLDEVMDKLSDTEYTLDPWPETIDEVIVNGEKMDRDLGVTSVCHPDHWLVKDGGSIPANRKRYYTVTVFNEFGETDRANEVRQITAAGSSTNRVPIEICPVPGAKGYRVYMTEDELEEQPERYSCRGIVLLDWDTNPNHLVAEITAEELRDAGYIVYDTGAAPLPGKPPLTHTAKRWLVDNINHKIVFDPYSSPDGEVKGIYAVSETVSGVLYLSHSRKSYLAGESGIFEATRGFPGRHYIIHREAGIVDLAYHNGLWFMTTNGTVKSMAGSTVAGDGRSYKGFAWLENKLARITASGTVLITSASGERVNEFSLERAEPFDCLGLSSYFDKLVTYDKNKNKFVVFSQDGPIFQEVNVPLNGIVAWNLTGVHLAAYTQYGTCVFRVHAKSYYGKLDKKYCLGDNPQVPHITRGLFPAEPPSPQPPELLPNGTLENGDLFPLGFNLYGDSSVDRGFSSEVNVPGTRAMYWHFPAQSWASINKYGLPVMGGKSYVFEVHHKATGVCNGYLGVAFRDENNYIVNPEGKEVFYLFQNTTGYQTFQVVAKAPMDAVKVDFRYLNYGSPGQPVTCFLNGFSVKETAYSITWERLFNGDFSLSAQGANMPTGFILFGNRPNDGVPALEPPTMQLEGRALKVTLPANSGGDWIAVQSDAFDVLEGDCLEVEFFYKRGRNIKSSQQVSLYYLTPSGDWGPAAHIYISYSSPTAGNKMKGVFPPNPPGYPKAKLRLWPHYDDSNYYEKVSVKPSSSANKAVNPGFEDGKAGWHFPDWGSRGTNTIDSSIYRTGTSSLRLEALFSSSEPYADVRQTITVNQTARRPIRITAWGAGQGIAPNILGQGWMQIECVFTLDDGTVVTNPAGIGQRFPAGNFAWTQVSFLYTAPVGRLVRSMEIRPAIGWGCRGVGWIDDIDVREDISGVAVDEIALTTSHSTVKTGTVEQIIINAQLMSGGSPAEIQGADVSFAATPAIGSFDTIASNGKGAARTIYRVPDVAGQVAITASYGGCSGSLLLTILPYAAKDDLEPVVGSLPAALNELYIEAVVPKLKKEYPDVTKRVGRWQYFRPTYFNQKQMLLYDVHHYHLSPFEHVESATVARIYPHLLHYQYFDFLSYHTRYPEYQEVMKNRKEWFALDPAGFPSPFGDGRVNYNWKNPDVVQWWVDDILKKVDPWVDIIYIDDYWGEAYWFTVNDMNADTPSRLLNYRTKRELIETHGKVIKLLREQANKRGFILCTNWGVPRPFNKSFAEGGDLNYYSALIAEPWDALLLEVWVYCYIDEPENIPHLTYESIRNEIEFLYWTERHGKPVVVFPRSSTEFYKARTFSLAVFLMGKHAHSYYCHGDWLPSGRADSYGRDWHEQLQPECFIYTGNPLEVYRDDDRLFSRRFENCVALLNMNENPKTYNLPPGTWYTTRGDSYSGTVTLGCKQAFVLVKERP